MTVKKIYVLDYKNGGIYVYNNIEDIYKDFKSYDFYIKENLLLARGGKIVGKIYEFEVV